MAHVAPRWRTLSEMQRLAWITAAEAEHSHSHLGQSGPLGGYNFFMQINSNLVDVGEAEMVIPPGFPEFPLNPVGDLVIANTGGVIALKLSVPSAPTRYTLVFGTKTRSAGSYFPGHFVFLGVLPDPVQGLSDITALYRAKRGVPTK
jgi:hypothetical protein